MQARKSIVDLARRGRVAIYRGLGKEPSVPIRAGSQLEVHGNPQYGGWAIPSGVVRSGSVVFDIGVGEDISFSESILAKYGGEVVGFDPTPRAADYVAKRAVAGFKFFPVGVAASTRHEKFHLPINDAHVSGSIVKSAHVGARTIDVELLSLDDMIQRAGGRTPNVLKMDVEGAEYEVIASPSFARIAPSIDIICIEFHHRWKEFGSGSTLRAVETLKRFGFECVWANRESNEEFTFQRFGV